MSEPQLSLELIHFIHTTLPSYDAAVLLVLFSRSPERVWTIVELTGAMGLGPDSEGQLRRYVEQFVEAGIVEGREEGTVRLAGPSHPSRAMVEELRIAYDRRPVTLIRTIDSAARAKIQSFAEAFKLKRDRE